MTLHPLLGSCKAHYAASVKKILPSAWRSATIARKASASILWSQKLFTNDSAGQARRERHHRNYILRRTAWRDS